MLRRIALGLVLALLSSGCATTMKKAYEGPELPRSEIAVLVGKYRYGGALTVALVVPLPRYRHETEIYEVDGKLVSGDSTSVQHNIHVLPGQHSVKVIYTRLPDVEFCAPTVLGAACYKKDDEFHDLSIDFTAKAGHEYRIPAERRGERNWIWVEDITESKTNGEVVVEVVAGEKPPDEKAKGKEPATPPE